VHAARIAQNVQQQQQQPLVKSATVQEQVLIEPFFFPGFPLFMLRFVLYLMLAANIPKIRV
jgi:hypothetical protein